MEGETKNDLERVYREHAPRIWRSLVAFTGEGEIASDAVAEAFAQVLQRGDAVRDPGRWVWRAAYRIAAGELKARGRTSPATDAGAAVQGPDHSDRSDEEADLMRALAQLPPRQRAAVSLRYIADLDNSEVARALGITATTVRVQLMLGRRRLRDLLGEHDA